MNRSEQISHRGSSRYYIFISFLFPIIIYWLTAHRSITWWDGSSYPLAAITLGVISPPGSLLLTILGWLIVKLPLAVSDILALNFFAGFLAAFTISMTLLITFRLFHRDEETIKMDRGRNQEWLPRTAGVAGVLTFAFGPTIWSYAAKFTPYILSVMFTALLLWAILKWWQNAELPSGSKWLFVVLLLFGLDFSVHRTNLLLAPGFIVIVFLHYPAVVRKLQSWVLGTVCLILGLAAQLLIIPMAVRQPIINMNNPSNWERFYEYISLKQYGGGWLVQFFPRKAPFFDVQVMDYLSDFAANFAHWNGAFGIVGVLPLLLGLVGILFLWQRQARLTIAFLVLFVCTSLIAIVYFNVSENFFRTMDRHYLPSFLIFGIFITYGAGSLIEFIQKSDYRYRSGLLALTLVFLAALPLNQLMSNYSSVDGSKRFFASDYADNVMRTLPDNAVLFVSGDNLWPLLYLQVAENARPDVTILSRSLMNTSWYVRQITARYPDLPIDLSEDKLSKIGPRLWQDSTVYVPFRRYANTHAPGEPAVDSVAIDIPPTIAGQYILAQDWLLVEMLVKNEWRRPFCFDNPPQWLGQFAIEAGLFKCLIPEDTAMVNCVLLRENLLRRIMYRGFNDPSIPLEMMSMYTGRVLYGSLVTLALCEFNSGDTTAAREAIRLLEKSLPVDRIEPDEFLLSRYEQLAEQLVGQ